MELHLDYSIRDLEKRKEIVDNICRLNEDDLSPNNLSALSDYLIFATPTNKEILTRNRQHTINKRECYAEDIRNTYIDNPDNMYKIINTQGDKNVLLDKKDSITEEDFKNIPELRQIKEALDYYLSLPHRNYIIQKAIVDLSATQYLLKNSYYQPVQSKSISANKETHINWDGKIDFTDKRTIMALIKYYEKLKIENEENMNNSIYYVLEDFKELAKEAVGKNPVYETILRARIKGYGSQEIQDLIIKKHNVSYSLGHISTILNNNIPALIIEAAKEKELLYYYTFVRKGEWKRCSRCGKVKLLHPKFFSFNKQGNNTYYSICKECRKKK